MGHSCSILLVDDDPVTVRALVGMLQEFGELCVATSGADALRLARKRTPDLILLDVEMPGMSGFEVCAALKEHAPLSDVPVIFITSRDSAADEIKGLELGASDFIAKPPRAPLVAARVRMHLRLKHLSDALRDAAFRDGLTGVANRRHFDDAYAREWGRAQRKREPLSLLMLDIDQFKLYNDCYGHPGGDRCLTVVAAALRDALRRPTDLVARYGGEEFAILLPDTDAAGAQVVAQQMLQAVEKLGLRHEASTVAPLVSLSIGISTWCPAGRGLPPGLPWPEPADSPRMADLLRAADQALYAAKQAGRRQACFLALAHVAQPWRAVPAAPVPDHAAALTPLS